MVCARRRFHPGGSVVLALLLSALACPAPGPAGPGPAPPPPPCLGRDDSAVPGSAAGVAAVGAALESHVIAGVGLGVARGADVVWLQGFGEADPERGRAATADTPFAIASVTKVLVATAAMILVEQGALALDVDIGQQAPALAVVRNPAFADVAITPRMLLTHTSTLWDAPSSFDATHVTHGDATMPLREFVLGYFDPQHPAFGGSDIWWTDAPPGAFSCYSNMGFAVLGVLLEEVSGLPLEDLLQGSLLQPLGMDSTSFRVDAYCGDDVLARGVRPLGGARGDGFGDHDLADGAADPPGQPEGHPELASGMLKTTPRDLLRFTVAIASGGALEGRRVLDAATVAEMLTRQLDPGIAACGDGRSDPAHQALGFTHLPDPAGVDWVGHYGGMNGATSALWFDPDPAGLRYVAILNQLDLEAMGAVETAILLNAP